MSQVVHRTPMADMRDWVQSTTPSGSMVGCWRRTYESRNTSRTAPMYIRAELAGIDPTRDVEVTLEDGMLTIREKRREENQGQTPSRALLRLVSRTIGNAGRDRNREHHRLLSRRAAGDPSPLRSDEAA